MRCSTRLISTGACFDDFFWYFDVTALCIRYCNFLNLLSVDLI